MISEFSEALRGAPPHGFRRIPPGFHIAIGTDIKQAKAGTTGAIIGDPRQMVVSLTNLLFPVCCWNVFIGLQLESQTCCRYLICPKHIRTSSDIIVIER